MAERAKNSHKYIFIPREQLHFLSTLVKGIEVCSARNPASQKGLTQVTRVIELYSVSHLLLCYISALHNLMASKQQPCMCPWFWNFALSKPGCFPQDSPGLTHVVAVIGGLMGARQGGCIECSLSLMPGVLVLAIAYIINDLWNLLSFKSWIQASLNNKGNFQACKEKATSLIEN